VQIPQNKVQEFNSVSATISKSPESRWTVAFAVQREGQANLFTYPYVSVQTVPYPNGQEPNDSQMEQLVKEMVGSDFDQEIRDDLTADAAKAISAGSYGKMRWDKASKTVVVPMQMTIDGVGPVRVVMCGQFGKEAFVGVFCYATEEDFSAYKDDFRQIAKSFQFDEGAGYDETVSRPHTAASTSSIFDGSLEKGLTGGATAVLCSLIGGAYRRSKKTTAKVVAEGNTNENC
jgi:hypothetical protein